MAEPKPKNLATISSRPELVPIPREAQPLIAPKIENIYAGVSLTRNSHPMAGELAIRLTHSGATKNGEILKGDFVGIISDRTQFPGFLLDEANSELTAEVEQEKTAKVGRRGKLDNDGKVVLPTFKLTLRSTDGDESAVHEFPGMTAASATDIMRVAPLMLAIYGQDVAKMVGDRDTSPITFNLVDRKKEKVAASQAPQE